MRIWIAEQFQRPLFEFARLNGKHRTLRPPVKLGRHCRYPTVRQRGRRARRRYEINVCSRQNFVHGCKRAASKRHTNHPFINVSIAASTCFCVYAFSSSSSASSKSLRPRYRINVTSCALVCSGSPAAAAPEAFLFISFPSRSPLPSVPIGSAPSAYTPQNNHRTRLNRCV